MTISDLGTFIKTLLAICGGISVLVGAFTGVVKVSEILNKRKKEKETSTEQALKQHSADIKELKDDMKIVKAEVNESKETNALLLEGVKSLINHAITGNGVDQLRENRTKIDDYLVNKVKQ